MFSPPRNLWHSACVLRLCWSSPNLGYAVMEIVLCHYAYAVGWPQGKRPGHIILPSNTRLMINPVMLMLDYTYVSIAIKTLGQVRTGIMTELDILGCCIRALFICELPISLRGRNDYKRNRKMFRDMILW